MSKSLFIIVALCALVAFTSAEEELYSAKYDYVDVDAILHNDRIRNQYLDCFMGVAPCITADAKFFKDKFPESIVSKCRRCTEKQKEHFEKIVVFFSEKHPEQWNMLLAKAIANAQKKRQ